MQLGFIGLGNMGRPMARHLVEGGHALAVFARRPETAQPLVDAGATLCASPSAVAERSDVIFTMVTGTSDVRARHGSPEICDVLWRISVV